VMESGRIVTKRKDFLNPIIIVDKKHFFRD